MWMPSDRPIYNDGREPATLDWETIGRAIRECLLYALETHAIEMHLSLDETVVTWRSAGGSHERN